VIGVGLMAIDMLRARRLPHDDHPPAMSPLPAQSGPES